MNYLICMLLIGLAMLFFLRVVAVLEHGAWPSSDVRGMSSALRELLIGRRVS